MAEVLEIDPFDPRVDKRKLQYASIIQETRYSLVGLLLLTAVLEVGCKVLVALTLIEQDPLQEKNSFKWSSSTAIGFLTFLDVVISLYLFNFPGGKDKVLLKLSDSPSLQIKDDIPCSHRITSIIFLQATFNILTKIISALLIIQIETTDPVVLSLAPVRPYSPYILVATILFCDIIFLLVHENFEVIGYNPLANSKSYERQEATEENDGNMALVSSGAFRIVLRNISSFSWLEPQIQVYRHTSDTSGRHKDYRFVQFTVSLEKEVPPGEELVLVPEPVYEEGAVEVPGYRGFGLETAEQIFTSVKVPGAEDAIAKMTENYKKLKHGRRGAEYN